MYEVKNALITNVSLSVADHGCLSGWVHLSFDSSGQGFGGYALYSENERYKARNYAGLWIWRICEIVGSSTWEGLKGRPCRIDHTHSDIRAIGNFIEDKWFRPKEEFIALENDPTYDI